MRHPFAPTLVALSVLALLLIAPRLPLAQPSEAAPATTSATTATSGKEVTSVESIRRFMEKGQGLFASGKYVNAAEVFEAGFELHPYSAFLFNAGVALEKAGRLEDAKARFLRYLEVDPTTPDHKEVVSRIARLEVSIAAMKAPGGQPSAVSSESEATMQTKSLVVLETDPPVAPLRLYRLVSGQDPYRLGEPNPGWAEVQQNRSPANLSLDVGRYYALVEKFDTYNESGAEFEVQPGRVVQVKVSLSQGEFMAYLRIVSNVTGAQVFVDDLEKKRAPWGMAPHGELVTAGEHVLLLTATGYQPKSQRVSLERGRQYDLKIELERLPFGTLRIDSNAPEVSVFVDGRSVGTWKTGPRPLDIPNLSAGSHKLEVRAPDRKPLEATIVIPRGQVLPVNAHMVVLPPRGTAYTQAIISSVLLGGGIYLGLESNRIYDDLKADRRRGVLESDDSRVTYGQIYAISADAAFLGAGVLAGLSVYNFLHDPLPPSRLATDPTVEFDAPPVLSQTLQKVKARAKEPATPVQTGRLRRPSGFDRWAPPEEHLSP